MIRLLLFATLLTSSLEAKTIRWFCDPQSVNQSSSGVAMDGSFRFELGVFTGGFVPSAANTSQWAGHWSSPQRAIYNPDTRFFSRQYTVSSNAAPYTAGAQAWIWGFGGTAGDQWILLRASTWTWPVADPLDPVPLAWNVADATVVVVGSVNGSGYLMRSATASDGVPPTTSYAQWQAEELSGVALGGPQQDADGDGVENILEFVFGTNPRVASRLPASSATIVSLSGQNYLQVSIPRRKDRPATLSPQVSSDLQQWQSATGIVDVASDGAQALVLRSVAPISPQVPRLFVRLQAN